MVYMLLQQQQAFVLYNGYKQDFEALKVTVHQLLNDEGLSTPVT